MQNWMSDVVVGLQERVCQHWVHIGFSGTFPSPGCHPQADVGSGQMPSYASLWIIAHLCFRIRYNWINVHFCHWNLSTSWTCSFSLYSLFSSQSPQQGEGSAQNNNMGFWWSGQYTRHILHIFQSEDMCLFSFQGSNSCFSMHLQNTHTNMHTTMD